MKDVFKALADPTRREILLMISSKPTSVNSIAEKFEMSRPAISKHIKILMDNELLETKPDETDGRQRNCHPQLEALQEVNEYIQQLKEFWTKRFDNLGQYLDQVKKDKSQNS